MEETPQPISELDEVRDLRAQTQAILEQIELLKTKGAEAHKRVDEFYASNGIKAGDGLRVLTSDPVDPRDQYIFLRLFAELEKIPEKVEAFMKGNDPFAPKVSAQIRSLNHKYRI